MLTREIRAISVIRSRERHEARGTTHSSLQCSASSSQRKVLLSPMGAEKEEAAVRRFRQYLRCPSVHPNPDYSGCIEWVKRQGREIGLHFSISRFGGADEFAVWLTWVGAEPCLPSILLNSHMDVVPAVERSQWEYEPFSGAKDAAGNIHGRGAVDMKCVGAQYVEAVRSLKGGGCVPLRTVHICFVPDEEVGGFGGMGKFISSPHFAQLNVGFALDEGLASADEHYNFYYGERAVCQFRVTATGATGDSALLLDDTAAEKLHFVISKLMAVRSEQKRLWSSAPHVDLGDITSVNLTMLSGGVDAAVLPSCLSAVFDLRITPQWRMEDVMRFLYEVCVEAGPGVSYTLGQHSSVTAATNLTDDNVWWTTFKAAADRMCLQLRPRVFPVATDVRFIRESGIPAFGFSPMNNMPHNLHTHHEFIHQATFLQGIHIYEELIRSLANVPPSPTTP